MMITGLMFRDGVISGSNNIANNRQAVDALNIFPVPDGDTGTNMSMTIGAAAKEMAVLPENCTVEEASARCASALLRGARGNSGVILSLIFRGFSKALRGMEEADGAAVAAAFRKGVDAAYKAVMKPAEGTILTVSRGADCCLQQRRLDRVLRSHGRRRGSPGKDAGTAAGAEKGRRGRCRRAGSGSDFPGYGRRA